MDSDSSLKKKAQKNAKQTQKLFDKIISRLGQKEGEKKETLLSEQLLRDLYGHITQGKSEDLQIMYREIIEAHQSVLVKADKAKDLLQQWVKNDEQRRNEEPELMRISQERMESEQRRVREQEDSLKAEIMKSVQKERVLVERQEESSRQLADTRTKLQTVQEQLQQINNSYQDTATRLASAEDVLALQAEQIRRLQQEGGKLQQEIVRLQKTKEKVELQYQQLDLLANQAKETMEKELQAAMKHTEKVQLRGESITAALQQKEKEKIECSGLLSQSEELCKKYQLQTQQLNQRLYLRESEFQLQLQRIKEDSEAWRSKLQQQNRDLHEANIQLSFCIESLKQEKSKKDINTNATQWEGQLIVEVSHGLSFATREVFFDKTKKTFESTIRQISDLRKVWEQIQEQLNNYLLQLRQDISSLTAAKKKVANEQTESADKTQKVNTPTEIVFDKQPYERISQLTGQLYEAYQKINELTQRLANSQSEDKTVETADKKSKLGSFFRF